jgi:DNA-binding MarR family transcriptional regulator
MNDITPTKASDLETAVQVDDKIELRVWLRLLTCSTIIEQRVRGNLRDRFGITLPRFDVLAQLDRARDGLAMGELSKRLMVSNGNLTGLIDRLVHEGLVSRTPLPNDRRTHLVKLTDAGLAAFDEMAREHEDWIDTMLAGVDRSDLAALLELLGVLKDSLSTAGEPGA